MSSPVSSYHDESPNESQGDADVVPTPITPQVPKTPKAGVPPLCGGSSIVKLPRGSGLTSAVTGDHYPYAIPLGSPVWGYPQGYPGLPPVPVSQRPPACRGRSHERRKRRKRRSPSSSSSDSPERRKRRDNKHRHHKQPAEEVPPGQLASLLLTLQSVAESLKGGPVSQAPKTAVTAPCATPVVQITAPGQSASGPAPGTSSVLAPTVLTQSQGPWVDGAPSLVSEQDRLDICASDQFSAGAESEGPPDLTQVSEGESRTETPQTSSELASGEPAIPDELAQGEFDKVILELNRALGLGTVFEPAVATGSLGSWARVGPSSLSSTEPPQPLLTLTGNVWDRCAAIAQRPVTSCPRNLDRMIRVSEDQYKCLIQTPSLPQEAWDRLVLNRKAKVVQGAEGAPPSFKFQDSQREAADSDLRAFDRSARFGLKVASLQHLLAEWFTNHAETAPLPLRALMCRALSLSVTASCDQFARVAVRASVLRRRNVLPTLGMSAIAEGALKGAPILGGDLFGGTFAKVLEDDVLRRETFNKTSAPLRGSGPSGSRGAFRPPTQSPGRGRGRQSKPGSSRARGKPGSRGRGESRKSPSARPARGRGRGAGYAPRGR